MHIPLRMGLLNEQGESISVSLAGGERAEEHLCHVNQNTQTFTFFGVKSHPVPALLRGFSSPVKCEYDYSDAQLQILLAHEKDPFVAWDSGQTLMSRAVLGSYHKLLAGEDAGVDGSLAQLFVQILQHHDLEPYFCADLLTMPSLTYLCEMIEDINVAKLYEAKHLWLQSISEQAYEAFASKYEALRSTQETYAPTFAQMGRRRLANHSLAMMAYSQREEALELCKSHYASSDNLTDRVGAMHAINAAPSAIRQCMLERFYCDAKSHDLVLDRWFALQAYLPHEDTLANVNDLLGHADFVWSNPNRVRALLGAFVRNLPVLHHGSGRGYNWLVEQILKVDASNPQVAARIVEPMIHWRKYADSSREAMRGQLEYMMQANLSKDVYELVAKALQ